MRPLIRFARDEMGGGTVLGLFAFLIVAVVGGIAIDGANAIRVQTGMQAAADAAALAAASRTKDREDGIDRALRMAAATGMGARMDRDDVVYGTYDPDTRAFAPGGSAPNAARILLSRDSEHGNPLGTFLLRLIDVRSFDISVSATAASRAGAPVCGGTTFLGSQAVDTGGGNSFGGKTCVHGQTRAASGGGDRFGEGFTISSSSIDNVVVNGASQKEADRVRAERTLQPTIVPTLRERYDDLLAALNGRSSYRGDLLPAFIAGNGRTAPVVRWNDGYKNVEQADLTPGTIYVAKRDVNFLSGVKPKDVAVIAPGRIGSSGGVAPHLENVYFLADTVEPAGNSTWGPMGAPCGATEYNSYLLGLSRVSMGGSGGATLSGVVAAAPDVNIGGGWRGNNVYVETTASYASLGGRLDIVDCGAVPSSFIPLGNGAGDDTGALLVR